GADGEGGAGVAGAAFISLPDPFATALESSLAPAHAEANTSKKAQSEIRRLISFPSPVSTPNRCRAPRQQASSHHEPQRNSGERTVHHRDRPVVWRWARTSHRVCGGVPKLLRREGGEIRIAQRSNRPSSEDSIPEPITSESGRRACSATWRRGDVGVV